MVGSRKRHAPTFKAKVTREAVKQTKTFGALARTYQVHPVPISPWKQQLLASVESPFLDG